MNTDSWIAPVWQLKVNGEGFVPAKSKAHCFVNNESLCGSGRQITSEFDDGISWTSAEVLERPDMACKRCLSKWKRLYQVED